jgi:hypothetical protein
VIAGDLSDRELPPAWFSEYRSKLGYKPGVWAWHAYLSAYNGSDDINDTKPWVKRFNRFMRATSSSGGKKNSRIWLTEQAPMYHKPKVHYCEEIGVTHLKRLLALQRRSKRITRFYYYSFYGGLRNYKGHRQWDSGFADITRPDSTNQATIRKAYYTYKKKTNPSEPGTYQGTPECPPSW